MRRSLGINEGGARRKVRGRRSFPATVISRLEEPVPQPAFCAPRGAAGRGWLTKVDRLFDNMVERRVLGRESHSQLEFRAFDLAFADDALDLPLRGDADDLEEFAQSDVKRSSSIAILPKRVRV
jgi:hypothetical protein